MRPATRLARLEKLHRPWTRQEPQAEETPEEQAAYVKGFVEACVESQLISWDGSQWHVEPLGHNDGEGSEWIHELVSRLNALEPDDQENQ